MVKAVKKRKKKRNGYEIYTHDRIGHSFEKEKYHRDIDQVSWFMKH